MDVSSSGTQLKSIAAPSGWERRTIADICGFVTKGSTPTTYGYGWQDDGVLFLRSECVSEAGLNLAESMFISQEAHAALSRGEVRAGDILITITGNVGRVVLLQPDFGCANINQHIARIRVTDASVNAKFLFHYLSQPEIRGYYDSITTGQAYPQISLVQVRETEIPLPSPREQDAIAAAISDVDALFLELKQLIAKKLDLRQGAMQELLTGDRRLPGFCGRWRRTRLGAIGVFSKGSGIRKDEVLDHGIPCIRYGELYTHHHDFIRASYSFISPEIARQSQQLRRGDLLFAGSGETAEEIGKCAAFLDDDEVYAGSDIVIFSPREQDSLYLAYLMSHPSVVAQKCRMGQGDAVVHINARNLAAVEIDIPEFDEQTAVAGVLRDMDAEIAALEARREKTRSLKQGMMQELLTGRIRLV